MSKEFSNGVDMSGRILWIVLIIGAVALVFVVMRVPRVPGVPNSGGRACSGDTPRTYGSGAAGFTLCLPEGYTIHEAYQYENLGLGKEIGGVKFMIPATLAKGTNLATDSYVSIEEIPGAAQCSAALFLYQQPAAESFTEGETTYSVAARSGAAAGSHYEETVYAFPGTNCVAVRYVIHYGVLENYPAGEVRAFDADALRAQFDAIRRTLAMHS